MAGGAAQSLGYLDRSRAQGRAETQGERVALAQRMPLSMGRDPLQPGSVGGALRDLVPISSLSGSFRLCLESGSLTF